MVIDNQQDRLKIRINKDQLQFEVFYQNGGSENFGIPGHMIHYEIKGDIHHDLSVYNVAYITSLYIDPTITNHVYTETSRDIEVKTLIFNNGPKIIATAVKIATEPEFCVQLETAGILSEDGSNFPVDFNMYEILDLERFISSL